MVSPIELKRWYEFFQAMPYVPLRAHPQGAVPRKQEDRWRRCTDAGAPRKELEDSTTKKMPKGQGSVKQD